MSTKDTKDTKGYEEDEGHEGHGYFAPMDFIINLADADGFLYTTERL